MKEIHYLSMYIIIHGVFPTTGVQAQFILRVVCKPSCVNELSTNVM